MQKITVFRTASFSERRRRTGQRQGSAAQKFDKNGGQTERGTGFGGAASFGENSYQTETGIGVVADKQGEGEGSSGWAQWGAAAAAESANLRNGVGSKR
jgi:hypothetical protein